MNLSIMFNDFASTVSLVNAVCLVALWVAYQLLKVVYNISPFHPLYRFPGPKIAAATYLYEAYYDCWRLGLYGPKIARMHTKYGPVIRINPDELHCSDPAFTDEIYASSGRVRDKWQHQLNTGGAGPVSVTAFSTIRHDVHRIRRDPMAKFFSRTKMLSLENEVHHFAQKTKDKMLTFAGKGVFDVKEAFNCFTADVISYYAFGESMGFLAQDGWEPNFASWVKSFFKSAYIMRHNTLARKVAHIMPFMANYLGKDIQAVMRIMHVTIPGYIDNALENPHNGRVFAEMMSKPEAMSVEEKYRFSGEGFNLLLAGTETTAATLTVFTYWVLAKPTVYTRLLSEFSNAGINLQNIQWITLEKCPYFWATFQECLRMMPGVSHRSARIAPEEDLHYRSADGNIQWVIPQGTPISMTSMINHWNVGLFPNPDDFMPGRWLLLDGQPDKRLAKYLISFGKGSRACIGENLASCEFYIMAALILLCVVPRARLVDTTVENISYDHDLIVVQTKTGSVSVKIAID